MIDLQSITQYVEQDPNLSMLPDEFKKMAIEIMIDDLRSRKENENNQESALTNNKRSRLD